MEREFGVPKGLPWGALGQNPMYYLSLINLNTNTVLGPEELV